MSLSQTPSLSRAPVRVLRVALPATLLLCCLSACRSNAKTVDEVNDLIDHSQYEVALQKARRAHKKEPDEDWTDKLYRRASAAFLMQEGRMLTFAGDDEQALEKFFEAQELLPGASQIQQWIDKTNVKLADRFVGIGLEFESQDDLPSAHLAYQRALDYVPGEPTARSGLDRVKKFEQHRRNLGDQYYKGGVRSLFEFYLDEAFCLFKYAGKYKHDPQRTSQREAQVTRLLASERLALAQGLEEERLFAAARNEYRLALILDPESPVATDGYERMKVESEAESLLRQAEMFILRDYFDRAQELLEQGIALTAVQKEQFQGLSDSITEARQESVYEEGLTLERDYLYPEAVQVYEELLVSEEYFRDVRARVDTLRSYIELAQEKYKKAEQAESDEERLLFLEEIELIWPEYSDIADQLRVLRADISE